MGWSGSGCGRSRGQEGCDNGVEVILSVDCTAGDGAVMKGRSPSRAASTPLLSLSCICVYLYHLCFIISSFSSFFNLLLHLFNVLSIFIS